MVFAVLEILKFTMIKKINEKPQRKCKINEYKVDKTDQPHYIQTLSFF